MLYSRSIEDTLDPELFENPPAQYRGAPFWAWNCRLDKDVLLSQISQFGEMGMGGAHIHCRVGLDTPYLGEAFFDAVSACKDKMKQEGLLCWLYDEDRWPSGTAGGIVTREEKYRMRFLVFEPYEMEEEQQDGYMAAAKAVRSRKRKLLGYYRITLDSKGMLESYECVEDSAGGEIWCAWLEVSGNTPWFNNQSYVNTLDKSAIDRFLEVTHEEYYRRFQDDFGTVIPAIFTDEPQTAHKERLEDPFQKKAVILPFTDDFEETFKKEYGISILAGLPELIWEKKSNGYSQIRYLYHRHVCERFSEAFGDRVGEWCRNHGIALTGHMMNEWTLHSQTMAVGEAMRPMMNFGIPGIDMLCDRRELSTAKQAQSVARQMGRRGVMSEIYGVTGWTFDFRNHKLAGDWQAALGVTLRVPHLTWVSMEGEAKRDYPASIGYQSPWYKEYRELENHFARLNTALTRGKAKVRVGVIHPIESYWIYWGCQSHNADVRETLDTQFENLISWLLYGLIDFDFISESMLEDLDGQLRDAAEAKDGEQIIETADIYSHTFHGGCHAANFQVGEAAYEVIVVPGCVTLREHTYKRLQKFHSQGGRILFLGTAPSCMEGRESVDIRRLAEECGVIPFQRESLLNSLEPCRDIDMFTENAEGSDPSRMKHRENQKRAKNMFYQMRVDKGAEWLFLCHVNKPANEDITYTERLTIEIKGEYRPSLYDTVSGNITECAACYENGKTMITAYVSAHDSLLYRLAPGRYMEAGAAETPSFLKNKCGIWPDEAKKLLPEPEHFSLEEENCCLLDLAEYAFDEGEWQPEEELLRADNRFRKALGYPLRMEALAQPWLKQEEDEEVHRLRLRFRIDTEIAIEDVYLALEHPEKVQIYLNGNLCGNEERGWYVDQSIRRIYLGRIQKGKNLLELYMPFGEKTNVEWCWLLGRFGVKVSGRKKRLTAYPGVIYYGDYVTQGLPFYAGNLVYETSVETEAGELWTEISRYRGALLQIKVDGKKKGNLIYAPYRMNLGKVRAGKHKICIRVFGNRANAFGPVHNADRTETWYGPNLWRTRGNKWTYEYRLEEMGVLSAPLYWLVKDEEE
ncbi:hypothetical protein MCI89_10655 [Muricomes sp. OA1]|uniref:Glycoside hydrolase family 2 n=1 Tax=Hungatella hathewayi TaxID=154046 RepID=A0A3E2WQQ6_9FIRM|nr:MULTISPECIES: hypothetical protein [Clostridia]MCH1972798.1 hypothetical protein [Muricomes sp. OA1]RGC29471.1 hypothetical protein DWX41_14405 [Hungatella hathewayi]GKH31566.1 hypothetical protein CE91St64_09730 [Faecalicatena contorta]